MTGFSKDLTPLKGAAAVMFVGIQLPSTIDTPITNIL